MKNLVIVLVVVMAMGCEEGVDYFEADNGTDSTQTEVDYDSGTITATDGEVVIETDSETAIETETALTEKTETVEEPSRCTWDARQECIDDYVICMAEVPPPTAETMEEYQAAAAACGYTSCMCQYDLGCMDPRRLEPCKPHIYS